MKKIILASGSPRRIEMMKNNGYDPIIAPADVDETLPFDMEPASAVMYLALKKAAFTDALFTDDPERIIIAADTIVVDGNKIIGKPEDRDDAFRILTSLKNRNHQVMTGVCIIDSVSGLKTCICDITEVYFTDYSDEELDSYLDTDEPYDKAGAYAIQGTFAKYIQRFEGDYDNVVGFPWYRIAPYIAGFMNGQ